MPRTKSAVRMLLLYPYLTWNDGFPLRVAYQIHDDIMDWNNEDRLFNILVRNNEQSVEFIDRMEQLYISYTSKAKNELKKISDSVSKKHLEHLTDLTFLQF